MTVSEEFERFLELLGEKIKLKGWQKYRGGLDVKSKFAALTNSQSFGELFRERVDYFLIFKTFGVQNLKSNENTN